MLGSDTQPWLEGPVSCHTESWGTWLQQEAAKDLSWRSGRRPAERTWLDLYIDVVYGRSHDTVLRLAIKQGKSAMETVQATGIAEIWASIVNKATPEDQNGNKEGHEEGEKAMEDDDLAFELLAPSAEHASGPEIVRASSLDDDKRMIVDNIIENMRTNLRGRPSRS